MKLQYLPILLLCLSACQSAEKKESTDTTQTTINKIWVFKKVDTAKSNLQGSGTQWIGDNTIDMTNKDTLRYSTIATNNGSTTFSYKVSDDYIWLDGKKVYKILKLTDSTMELSSLYQIKGQDGIKKNAVVVVMDYKAR
jgi:hypothetical protein